MLYPSLSISLSLQEVIRVCAGMLYVLREGEREREERERGRESEREREREKDRQREGE